jgi:hypothetical protein
MKISLCEFAVTLDQSRLNLFRADDSVRIQLRPPTSFPHFHGEIYDVARFFWPGGNNNQRV